MNQMSEGEIVTVKRVAGGFERIRMRDIGKLLLELRE